MQKHFPKALKELRLAKLSETDELILLGLETRYLGIRAMASKAPIYWLGWFSLGGVALADSWTF